MVGLLNNRFPRHILRECEEFRCQPRCLQLVVGIPVSNRKNLALELEFSQLSDFASCPSKGVLFIKAGYLSPLVIEKRVCENILIRNSELPDNRQNEFFKRARKDKDVFPVFSQEFFIPYKRRGDVLFEEFNKRLNVSFI